MGGAVVSLRLRVDQFRAIESQLEGSYPEEGCGALLGRENGDGREVERAIAFTNVQTETRERRFLVSPEQLLGAEREARRLGLEVLGIYHSHPDHPARPSAFDLEHAWPFYSYLIVSVAGGRAAGTRSWRLVEDRSRFVPETLEIAADGSAPAAAREARGPA